MVLFYEMPPRLLWLAEAFGAGGRREGKRPQGWARGQMWGALNAEVGSDLNKAVR